MFLFNLVNGLYFFCNVEDTNGSRLFFGEIMKKSANLLVFPVLSSIFKGECVQFGKRFKYLNKTIGFLSSVLVAVLG